MYSYIRTCGAFVRQLAPMLSQSDPLTNTLIYTVIFFPLYTLKKSRHLILLSFGRYTSIWIVKVYNDNFEGIARLF